MENKHADMSNEEYHKHPSIGSTVVKSALKSARKYQRAIQGQFKQTASMALGDAVHADTLEPERFEEMYEVEVKKATAKTPSKTKLVAKIDGILDIPPADYLKFLSMKKALAECKEFQALMAQSKGIEKSFFATLEGYDVKCRTDFLIREGWIVDVKTCGGEGEPSSPEEFGRSFFDYGYDVSMVLYTNVVEAVLDTQVKGFIFASVDSKKEDSGVKIYKFARGESQWWKIGKHRLEAGLAKIDDYKDMEEFPVYEKVIETDLPLPYAATNYAVENEVL